MEVTKVTLPNAIMLGEVSRLIDEGHEVVVMTKGCSMHPFIKGGSDSVRLVRPTGAQVGDIVLAEIKPGHYVLHRLFSVGEGDNVVLKGDGNLVGVENCRLGDLRGKAIHIVHEDGSETDCMTGSFGRWSRLWRRSPYIVRRIVLAIYRRVI